MKKGFLLGVLLLGAGAVSAQGLYAGFQVGYGMATSTDVLGSTTTVTSTGDQTETNIYGTLGGGTAFGLNLGYNFSEHFGAELGVNYFLGSSVSVTEVTVPTGGVQANAQSSQIRLTPMLVVRTGGDFGVYGKGGLVLPVSGSTTLDVTDNTNPLVGTVEQSFETKGSISLGFQGAAGVNYNLSDNLSLFAELSAVNLRIKAATRSMTKNSVAGTDVLESMDTYDKETTYVDQLTSSSNNSSYNLTSVDQNAAREDLATKTNFSALFFNIGITYSL